MRKFTKLAVLAAMMFGVFGSQNIAAATLDELHSVVGADNGWAGDIFFWNDVNDNGLYHPNWRIAFAALEGFDSTEDLLEKSMAYVIKNADGTTVQEGKAIQTRNEKLDWSAYAGGFAFEAGNYTIDYTFSWESDGVTKSLQPISQSFTVGASAPTVNFTYNTTPAANSCIVNYEFALNNFDGLTPTDYTITFGSTNADYTQTFTGLERQGSVTLDMKGQQQITFWVKPVVTYTKGDASISLNAVEFDRAADFKAGETGTPVEKQAPTLSYQKDASTYSLSTDENGQVTLNFKYSFGNPDNVEIDNLRFGAVVSAGLGIEGGEWPGDAGVLVGQCTVGAADITADGSATMYINGLKANENNTLYMKWAINLKEGDPIRGGELIINYTPTTEGGDQPEKPGLLGEAVHTQQYTVTGATFEDDKITWVCPIEGETFNGETINGVSGDYISTRTYAQGNGTLWAPTFNAAVSNDAAGHIFGEVTLPDNTPVGLNPFIWINNNKYPLVPAGEGKYTFSTATDSYNYTYANEKVVSFHFDFNHAEANTWTKVFTYTMTNSTKNAQSFTVEDVAKNLGWEYPVQTEMLTVQGAPSEAAVTDHDFWSHSGSPLDQEGKYWAPEFYYVLSYEHSAEASDNSKVNASIRFINPTTMPSDFNASYSIYAVGDDGKVKMHQTEQGEWVYDEPVLKGIPLTAEPQVINLFDGTSADGLPNGQYAVQFNYEYTSVRSGNGYSSTNLANPMYQFTVLNGPTTGIEDIEAAEEGAPAIYYNLQGVRMQGELAPGLYIEVRGNRSSKVLVR